MTDLRTLLRGGDAVPAFRMLLPQGWVAHRPDERGERQLLDAAAKKLAAAGRPELLAQLRAHASVAYRQLREQRAFLVIMPGEGTPQALFLPATITGIERVDTPDAPVREVVIDAIRSKGAKPLDRAGMIVRWVERRDVALDGEQTATTSISYMIPIPGAERRRAVQLTAVITHPTDLPADDEVLERWIALIDTHVATFSWEP
ncbi:hypothetical protein [Agrococcus sp. Marseille-P2731]|uniref:hypothetical protein n=1 Tax=Agrococcus sp. Marseille-P2731 TaxID=1841862 RepID=UPI000931B19C|nr:hypothetical protein [Agrococcus sp. Marseille-P2731]